MTQQNSTLEMEARSMEREAMAAAADIERLVADLTAAPEQARAAILAQLDADRKQLEAIASRAHQAIEVRRTAHEAHMARLEQDVSAHVDELKRKQAAADKAEAEATYANTAYTLESARVYAKNGIHLALENVQVNESSLASA